MSFTINSTNGDWDALRSVYRDPAEDLFWTACRAMAGDYAASHHEATLLTIDNLDAFAAAYWEGRA